MKNSKGLVGLLIAVVVLMGVFYVAQYSWFMSQNGFRGFQPDRSYGQLYGPGMMGGFRGRGMMNGYGYRNGYDGMMGGYQNYYNNELIDESSANSEMDKSLKDVTINKQDNSITYTGDNIKIVMFGGPEGADDKFVIGGLVNPTIYVSEGGEVNLELINKDKGMSHGILITEAAPPYYSMTMMQGGTYPGSYVPVIPRAQDDKYSVAKAAFRARYKGEFYYICQYPGHAQDGMYGKIIVQ